MKYHAAENVDWALRMLRRGRITPILASRDMNITPALLQRKFQRKVKVEYPPLAARVALSEQEEGRGLPRALLLREGLLPYAETVTGSRRLCSAARKAGPGPSELRRRGTPGLLPLHAAELFPDGTRHHAGLPAPLAPGRPAPHRPGGKRVKPNKNAPAPGSQRSQGRGFLWNTENLAAAGITLPGIPAGRGGRPAWPCGPRDTGPPGAGGPAPGGRLWPGRWGRVGRPSPPAAAAPAPHTGG